MGKLKYTLGAGATSVAMALGVALPVAAQQSTDCTGGVVSTNVCPNVNVDNSNTRVVTLGDCSAIIRNEVVQLQETTAVTGQANVGAGTGAGAGGAGTGTGTGVAGDGTGVGVGGGGTGTGSNEQSNNSTNTATGTQNGGVNFAPDCSTTNNNPVREVVHTREVVHHQAAAASATGGSGSGVVLAASTQVEAPVGGANAGAGGAAGSIASSLFGLGGSLVTLGAGALRLRKQL